MTFDHQIDFDPATRGSAATTLKTERQVIVRKLLVAQAFATVPENVGGDHASTETADKVANG